LEIKFPYVLLAGGGRSKTTEGGLDNQNLIGVGFSTDHSKKLIGDRLPKLGRNLKLQSLAAERSERRGA